MFSFLNRIKFVSPEIRQTTKLINNNFRKFKSHRHWLFHKTKTALFNSKVSQLYHQSLPFSFVFPLKCPLSHAKKSISCVATWYNLDVLSFVSLSFFRGKNAMLRYLRIVSCLFLIYFLQTIRPKECSLHLYYFLKYNASIKGTFFQNPISIWRWIYQIKQMIKKLLHK